MTYVHDALCPHRIIEYRVICSECELIRRVRLDEQKHAYHDGYQQALEDAQCELIEFSGEGEAAEYVRLGDALIVISLLADDEDL